MSDAVSEPETLETLQARHRKEQRDLVSRITQKKKQASKKTRKGVNDECERLEQELKERQDRELATLNGEVVEEKDEGSQDETKLEEAVTNLATNGSSNASADPSVNGDDAEDTATKKKPNRAKARLARRAAEQDALIAEAQREAANAPNPRELERERMATQLEQNKLALHEIRADGHCLYSAVADQLATRKLGTKPHIPITTHTSSSSSSKVEPYKQVRNTAADWIEQHADDFAGFMEDPLDEHVRKIRETGEWGGHLELLALARAHGLRICVLHSDGRVDRIVPEEDKEDMGEIWLGYYKHSHGLGEHYNSLRKIG
jgi:OTU domain-containing protein 6